MRLTKQYASGFLATLPEELMVPMYYELKKMSSIFEKSTDYINIVEFDLEEFDQFRKILKDEFHPLLINFLEVLAQDGLLNRLDTIIEDYELSLIEANVLFDVRVTSARELSADFKEKIEKLVQERWGNNYLLAFKVDKALIGGVRLEVNEAVVDTTFRSRIDQILRGV